MTIISEIVEAATKAREERFKNGFTSHRMDKDTDLYQCPNCFALVLDWESHMIWHEKLRRSVNEIEILD